MTDLVEVALANELVVLEDERPHLNHKLLLRLRDCCRLTCNVYHSDIKVFSRHYFASTEATRGWSPCALVTPPELVPSSYE